jgi:biotin transport system substrate-specific component
MQTAIGQSSSNIFDTGFTRSIPGKIVLGLAATLFVAAASHVSIPLWFTPVPLSLQPLAVLGVGLAMGPVAGFLTMIAYLLEGAMGLPVFSPTGLGGVAQLFGPTGGYLLAYPLVALIVGAVTRGLQVKLPRFVAAAIGCTAAVMLLFACGAAWLMNFAHLSTHQVWIAAVAPFLPGEAIKIVVGAGLYSSLSRSMRS